MTEDQKEDMQHLRETMNDKLETHAYQQIETKITSDETATDNSLHKTITENVYADAKHAKAEYAKAKDTKAEHAKTEHADAIEHADAQENIHAQENVHTQENAHAKENAHANKHLKNNAEDIKCESIQNKEQNDMIEQLSKEDSIQQTKNVKDLAPEIIISSEQTQLLNQKLETDDSQLRSVES